MSTNLLIEIIGAIIGLTYLYLEYKAHKSLWYVGIVMSLFYMYIFLTSHFYADFGVYVYYLCANTYGLILWNKREKNGTLTTEEANPITHVRLSAILPLALIFVACWGLLWFVLSHLPNSASPIGDSFTTALSVVAMWLMAQKNVEHWLLWIIVNLVSTLLYVTKGLYPTAILFCVYTIGSVLGYFNWEREISRREN